MLRNTVPNLFETDSRDDEYKNDFFQRTQTLAERVQPGSE